VPVLLPVHRKSFGASLLRFVSGLAKSQQGKRAMPPYFFHLLEKTTNELVKDPAGTFLPDAMATKKEALGLARDVVRHGFHTACWDVLVTDMDEALVTRVPLAKVRLSKLKACFDVARRFSIYKPRHHERILTWLLITVVLL
jgi:hypothetical protein